jgi:hypothetical protein
LPDRGWLDWFMAWRADAVTGTTARSIPQPFEVEVQPPQHVREQVALEMDGEASAEELRFVLYNDADKGEWLRPSHNRD